MRTAKGTALSIVITCASLCLVGCASSGQASVKSETEGSPNFTGPYAEEFRQEYESASVDVARTYLEDGRISEAEAQAMIEDFRTCLRDRGITLDRYDAEGVLMTGDPRKIEMGEVQETAERCSSVTGEASVLSLYFLEKRDPQNEVTPQKIVECYIRAGLVPDGFSVEEYSSGGFQELYPPEYLYEPSGEDDLKAITSCNDDPLSAFAE